MKRVVVPLVVLGALCLVAVVAVAWHRQGGPKYESCGCDTLAYIEKHSLTNTVEWIYPQIPAGEIHGAVKRLCTLEGSKNLTMAQYSRMAVSAFEGKGRRPPTMGQGGDLTAAVQWHTDCGWGSPPTTLGI